MGIGGSAQRRFQRQRHHSPGQYSYDDRSVRPTEDLSISCANVSSKASTHNPQILVPSVTFLKRPDHYEVQTQPSTRKLGYSPEMSARPTRMAFHCNREIGTQTLECAAAPEPAPQLPPPPRSQPPMESCNCKTCREKNQTAYETIATTSAAANTTFGAHKNQCPPSTSVAHRTAVPSNKTTTTSTCTGCPSHDAQTNTPIHATTERGTSMDHASLTTCGQFNYGGYVDNMPAEYSTPIPFSGRNSSSGYDRIPCMQQTSMINMAMRQSMMATRTSITCHGGGGSASVSAPNDIVSEFHKECLDAHNRLRARHQNCPPLTLSSELSRYAQQWAKHLASTGRLEHRKTPTYGENLYTSYGMAVNGSTVVQTWYDEIRYYDFSNPNYKPGTGHFTQIIWRDSRQLGVGIAKKGESTYVVCNYDPPGNIIGHFDGMVTPHK